MGANRPAALRGHQPEAFSALTLTGLKTTTDSGGRNTEMLSAGQPKKVHESGPDAV